MGRDCGEISPSCRSCCVPKNDEQKKAARNLTPKCGPYFEQTCAKEWHHCPFSQIDRAAPAPVPQRHLALACWPSAQVAIMGLCA